MEVVAMHSCGKVLLCGCWYCVERILSSSVFHCYKIPHKHPLVKGQFVTGPGPASPNLSSLFYQSIPMHTPSMHIMMINKGNNSIILYPSHSHIPTGTATITIKINSHIYSVSLTTLLAIGPRSCSVLANCVRS